jgi:hypothetical protein
MLGIIWTGSDRVTERFPCDPIGLHLDAPNDSTWKLNDIRYCQYCFVAKTLIEHGDDGSVNCLIAGVVCEPEAFLQQAHG